MPRSSLTKAALPLLTCALAAGALAGKRIPTNLPHPDDTPPATDKPVKVYIMSGQSNMVGFGTIGGGGKAHSSIYLSADPSVMPCKMPVGSSALLPHAVYQDATGEATGAKAFVYEGAYNPATDYSALKPAKQTTVALGTASETLPTIDGPHTVVVKAFVEIPKSGMHQVHPGFGDSSYAVAAVDGQEVYRKTLDGDTEIAKVKLAQGKRYPLTVTYMKGGPAAFWMELVDLNPQGSLEALVQDGLFPWMAGEDGEWTKRSDVILNDAYLGKGRSVPLSPEANGKFFGPELGFGYIMGEFHDEPVLLIKSNIGNRSLAWDCLPPGSERYEVGDKVYAGYKDFKSSWPKGTEPPTKGGWYAGKQYDDYTEAIHKVLNNFDKIYPQYKDQGYEIAGFVWWQGHKDQNEVHASRYAHNLANLIKAWRKEFNAPDAKWAIATIAFGGWDLGGPGKTIAEAQLSVSGETGKYPEFRGNVKTIEARGFWRSLGESPTGKGYHYNHNAETYMLVGDSLGRAMVEMMGGEADPAPDTPRPEPAPDTPVKDMTLNEMARLVYTDAFISPWAKDPREPNAQQMAAMAPAMKPFIIDREIPNYVASAPGTPAYRRKGMSMVPIITGEKMDDKRSSAGLDSQLDYIISLYNAAGVHDYDWKRFGPDMQNAAWHYYSFDPPETLDKGKSDRYRDITLPDGMENWFAPDFDPAAAGWKQGEAPFGQNNGKLAPLSPRCRDPQCGCSIPPKTLWEHEVLLMRQTFELPKLPDDRRYRLIVGGSGHAFSGEGYAVYVNGKLFSESKSGFFKKGGTRGSYIFNDFRPEFEKGKVTIAVKSFLRTTYHKNKASAPRGHLSVWLEEVTIPPVVLRAVENAKK